MSHLLQSILKLPSPNDLKGKLQAIAMLDAILMSDWEMRYFSFNSKWGPGEMTGSMRDGQGSEFFFLFNSAGVAGKIYCEENQLGSNTAAALAQVPADFSSFVNEAAFSIDRATCYLWQRPKDSAWSIAPANTVGIPFLAFVADQGEYYCAWAQDYYERELNLEPVKAVVRHEPLTSELVASINPEMEMDAVLADADEIGYPR